MSRARQQLILYHGTSRDNAELIREHGFKPSSDGCLGKGVYVAHHDKAFRFAANCPRHGGDAGAVVKVRITFTNAKYVRGDDTTWRTEGHDACRTEYTSSSTIMEWCLASVSQVEFLAIHAVECGTSLPSFELPGFEESLSLEGVRRLAESEGMTEVFFDARTKVVSFAADEHDEKRFNIYYATGTIGTTYSHPKRSAATSFRRKADMQILGDLFRLAKRLHGACDCHHSVSRPRVAFDASASTRMPSVVAEEVEVRATLEQLRKEAAEAEAILADHQRLRDEEQRRKEEEQRRAAEMARREAERVKREEEERERERKRQQKKQAQAEQQRQRQLRGTRCQYWLPKTWHETIDNNFGEETLSVALGDDCLFMLNERGGWNWRGDVPKGLANKLQGRQAHLPASAYVSMGTRGRYLIKFADGQMQWSGPDDLTEELQGTKRSVRSVAFGEEYETWFVVYADGYWKWAGMIPSGLKKVLDDRQKKSDLKHVSLGPDGEYFIAVANGRMWWGGMTDEALDRVRPYKDRLTFIDFGDSGRQFIRYE